MARDKGAFEHEAALALAKAQTSRRVTAKAVAHAIAQLLEARGLVVCLKPHRGNEYPSPKPDAHVRYYTSKTKRPRHQLEIRITEN
jgi:hypothetical protein